MAEWTWNYDTTTGVYKSHSISAKLREQAIVESVFADFVRLSLRQESRERH